MKEEFAVEVKGLTKVFGNFTAVDHIDLKVIKGKIFGFLGPNGAGKSTTIKMLCGLLLPTSGEGTIAGSDIYRESEEIKENRIYVAKFSLYDDLTVEENIDFCRDLQSPLTIRPEEKPGYLKCRTSPFTHQASHVLWLEGGNRGLHSAVPLSTNHPSSFLIYFRVDPISRRRLNLISDIAREGTTVFVTTHYMEEAEYCDER